jgi:dihydroxyacetone kinase DhaKLM complex PTS-EIIA-like component DhaM
MIKMALMNISTVCDVAEGVVSLCEQAKWKRVYIIASDTSDEGTLGDAVYTAITTKTNITVTTYSKDGITVNYSMDGIKAIFDKVKLEARSKKFRILLNVSRF